MDEHHELHVEVVRLQEKMIAVEEKIKSHAPMSELLSLKKTIEAKVAREWTVIGTGISLVGAIVAKNLGWL